MTAYVPDSPEQDARFVAFTAKCESLIARADTHDNVVAFIRTLDIDGARALRGYAVRAGADTLRDLIDATWEDRP